MRECETATKAAPVSPMGAISTAKVTTNEIVHKTPVDNNNYALI